MAAAPLAESRPGSDRWLQKGNRDPAARMPLFGDVMVAAAHYWTESFCNLAATEGEVAYRGVQLVKVADLPRERGSLPILASLRVASWETMIGLGLDRAGVSTVLEAFFGGGEEEEVPPDSRPLSPIEIRLVEVFGGQAAAALSGAFRDVLPTRFEFDKTLIKPEPKFLGKPTSAILLASFELRTVGRTVSIDVLFPQAAIDARSAVFVEASAAGPPLDAVGWTQQFKTEVTRASLAMEASVAMKPMTLGELASMQIGQVLELPTGATTSVVLRCGEETLFRCQLGQSSGFYTVQVEEVLERDAQSPRKTR